MREYKVWDEDRMCFIDESQCVYSDGTIFRNARDFEDMISDDLTMLWNIGKTDIDEKNIYADSSIVEFRYFKDMDTIIDLKGYFTFNRNTLSYSLRVFGDNNENLDFFKAHARVISLRVIGTLQENPKLLNEK